MDINHEMHINLRDIDDRLMLCMFIPGKKKEGDTLVLLGKKDGIITAFSSRKKQLGNTRVICLAV